MTVRVVALSSAEADDPLTRDSDAPQYNEALYCIPALAAMTIRSRSRKRTASAVDSPHRRRVLNAAFGPQPIDAATDTELGARSHVALEHFTVIADLSDNAHHPVLRQPELLAEITLNSQQASDFRLVLLQRLV